jgi:hypothetical protein
MLELLISEFDDIKMLLRLEIVFYRTLEEYHTRQ